jgi:glycosyltransferase involved in cell wall biosynthesis
MSRQLGGELAIMAFSQEKMKAETAFSHDLLNGLNYRLVNPATVTVDEILSFILEYQPDVIVFPGWMDQYRSLVDHKALKSVAKVIAIDHDWRGGVKQNLTRHLRKRYVRQFDAALVPGERGYQYTKRHGMDPHRIFTLMNSYDAASFDPVAAERPRDGNHWPRRFIFVGRYIEVKNIPFMVEAFRRYRLRVEEPWELVCYGRGPEGRLLAGEPGIRDEGFCDPRDLPAAMRQAGALILPSTSETWGVVAVEALATGMPVLLSRACGAAGELIKPYHNGFTFEPDDPNGLADALVWLTGNTERVAGWVDHASHTACAYRPELWAENLLKVLHFARTHAG